MTWIRRIAREFWGLFVDDGSFAVAILVWIGVCVFLFKSVLPAEWSGPVLFVGVAAVLVENVRRSARR